MEIRTNRIETDAAPSYAVEVKKTKKNKRKYWKRNNSKAPAEGQEGYDERERLEGREGQGPINAGDITPGSNSGNFESESFEEEEIETQDDEDCENNNDNPQEENKEECFTEGNVSNERFNEFNKQTTNVKQLMDFGDSFQRRLENIHVSENLETQISKTDSTLGSAKVDGQMFGFPQVASPLINDTLIEKFGTETPEEFIDEDENTPTPIYNTRFLTKDADTYEVENFEKNIMIIFNHYEIIGYKPREGTQKDIDKLIETFGRYNFKPENIIVCNDYNYRDLTATLTEFSKSDFTDYGCVVVVVLTHGKEGGYLMAKDRSYNEIELIDHFFNKGNQTLVTKPKVFIVQACRGSKISPAVLVGEAGQTTSQTQIDTARERQVYHQPTEADVLLLHSTFAGDASHRETLHGSWFIQSLCTHIDQLADSMDLEDIMTTVKKHVAINKAHEVKNRGTGKTDINKQMPVLMSTLTRKLYLKKPKSTIGRDCQIPPGISVVDTPNDRCAECTNRRSIQPKQHFIHMRNALRLYHAHSAPASTANPGQTLLNIANSIDEHATPVTTVDTIANEISAYLRAHAALWECYSIVLFL